MEEWIDAAIERYQLGERLRGELDKALATQEVTVRSADGLVELVVGADGGVRDVHISESAVGRSPRELARAVQEAIDSAAQAAAWARAKLSQELLGEFPDLLALRRDR